MKLRYKLCISIAATWNAYTDEKITDNHYNHYNIIV